MALTPIDFIITEVDIVDESEETLEELATETSRTWKLDFETGRIGAIIDDEEAIRQYIRKSLITARNRYLIYDDFYGEQVRELIGENVTPALLQVEIPRLVREALIYDERIEDIPTIIVSQYNSNSVLVEVTVELVDGEFINEEVEL